MRPYVVFQGKFGGFGYRRTSSMSAAVRIAQGLAGRGEVIQAWSISAWSGNDAVSRIKKALKAKGLK